jgi:hypothetical protein
MNLVCLPGQPCYQAVQAIQFMNGGLRPLLGISNRGQNIGRKLIGLAFYNGNELLFMNRCPFCGADLFVPLIGKEVKNHE